MEISNTFTSIYVTVFLSVLSEETNDMEHDPQIKSDIWNDDFILFVLFCIKFIVILQSVYVKVNKCVRFQALLRIFFRFEDLRICCKC